MKINTAFFIARRYFLNQKSSSDTSSNTVDNKKAESIIVNFLKFLMSFFSFSKKEIRNRYQNLANAFIQQNFIKILSNISMVGLGLGTAALVIILSVFNGLELLTMNLYNSYNSEIKITPKKGKSFVIDSLKMQQLKTIKGIQAITEVIEDNALMRYRDKQMVVNMKGVSTNFLEQYDINIGLVSGKAALKYKNQARSILGIGVQYQLSVSVRDSLYGLQLWYPKVGKKISMNPKKAFAKKTIRAGGVVGLEETFDNSFVLVPLEFAQSLMNYGKKRTSLEIKTTDNQDIEYIQKEIISILGNDFYIKNAEQQQEVILRAVRIERLFVFIAFIFILAIASFNVFFSLAMLAIEKKKDIAVLMTMGASTSFIKKIFIYEGSFIALSGAFWGLLFGFLISYIQQEFGIISLGVQSAVVSAYPVQVRLFDFVYTGIAIVIITILASYIPARTASQTVIVREV